MWLALVLKIFLPGAQAYAKPIAIQANEHGLDPLLVSAVIYNETRFRKNLCFVGGHGLMQIQLKPRSCTRSMAKARSLGLYSPKKNIRRGVRLMIWWKSWCLKHHSHLPKSLAHHWLLHYNQGFGICLRKGCKKSERIPIIRGRIGGYARRVLGHYERLKMLEMFVRVDTVESLI